MFDELKTQVRHVCKEKQQWLITTWKYKIMMKNFLIWHCQDSTGAVCLSHALRDVGNMKENLQKQLQMPQDCVDTLVYSTTAILHTLSERMDFLLQLSH